MPRQWRRGGGKVVEGRTPGGVVVRTFERADDAPYEERDARFWLVVLIVALVLLAIVVIAVLT